jgi:hypothetical protein
MKRLIVSILAAAMMAATFASCGSGNASESSSVAVINATEPDTKDKNGVGYKIHSDKTATVTQVDKNASKIVIPEKLEDKKVTRLSKSVFKMSKADTITLPDSIESISEYAFAFCRNLKSVNLPEGIKSIGQNSFTACESLKQITIPSTVRAIDIFSFDASGLETVTIPKSVKDVRGFAFADCENLKEVVFEGDSTHIEEKAFNNSDNVTIVAKADSEAMDYAKENNIKHKIIK